MPDPKKKKKKNTPVNAATDTSTGAQKKQAQKLEKKVTPIARAKNVTGNGKGVKKGELIGAGETVSGPEQGAGQTYGYHSHFHDTEKNKGYYPGQVQRLASASGGHGGRITGDAFLQGFNADDELFGYRKGTKRK